jgi:hypothetical protein
MYACIYVCVCAACLYIDIFVCVCVCVQMILDKKSDVTFSRDLWHMIFEYLPPRVLIGHVAPVCKFFHAFVDNRILGITVNREMKMNASGGKQVHWYVCVCVCMCMCVCVCVVFIAYLPPVHINTHRVDTSVPGWLPRWRDNFVKWGTTKAPQGFAIKVCV